jgi:hypothetical protein
MRLETMKLSMKGGLAILCVLIPCVLADTPYLLTTRERIDAKKAEMLKGYTRGNDVDRLKLYLGWNAADVRFRKSFFISVNVRTAGVDANDLGSSPAKIRRLEQSIRETATQMFEKRGFDLQHSPNDGSQVDITAWIIKPRAEENVYIIDGNVSYTRDLFDRERAKSICATMHQQRSLDYTSRREDIEDLARRLCIRSLEGFCNQMLDDETVMEVYYELLAKGLIEKSFQPK